MDQSQYKYSAMSNLVLQSDRRGRKINEPTGEPESLAGAVNTKLMGDKIKKSKPIFPRDVDPKFLKPRENDNERSLSSKQALNGKSILNSTLSVEGLTYHPQSSESRQILEHILAFVYDIIDDQSNEVIRSAADVIIEVLKNDSLKVPEMKKEVDSLIGIELTNEKFSQLFNLVKKINDFITNSTETDQQLHGSSNENAVAVIVNDEGSDNDLDANSDDTMSVSSQDELDVDVDIKELSDLEVVNDDEPTVSDATLDSSLRLVRASEIDLFWLQRLLGKEYSDPIERQEKATKSMSCLELAVKHPEDYSLVRLENDLMELFDYDHFEIVQTLIANRVKIIWISEYLQCENDDEKRTFVTKIHNLGLDSILNEFHGNNEIENVKILKDDLITEALNAKGTDQIMNDLMPTNVFNLSSMKFENGSHFMSNKKCILPAGTVKIEKKGYLEIDIPIPQSRNEIDNVQLVHISTLPKWARGAFIGSETLNWIQSKTFNTSFKSEENLLLCAPTGAGKTNVAMLCILREISRHMNPEINKPNLENLKIVYIAPLKALVQEVVGGFSKRLEYLDIKVNELTGDRSMTKKQIMSTNIIVTTPEKWDIITRKADEYSYTKLVSLLIIDEIHLLHDERGPVLESIISRSLRENDATKNVQRLIGLSATLPNYKDVATFMRINPSRGLYFFDNSFRPCPLKQSFVGITEKKAINRIKLLNEICYEKVIERVSQNQMIIFVHSRKETAKTATYIRDKALDDEKIQLILRNDAASREILQSEAGQSKDQNLQNLLPYGIAIHHAGLSRTDRQVAEDLFSEGIVKVLVSTATLAWGVNLPAHTVIIKGTQIYSPEKGSWTELSSQDVLQMLGRAGRPQYDTFGEGVILTSHKELQYYLSLMNQQLPIESHLIPKLADTMNAEIVLNNLSTRADAIDWLSKTYLYIRLLKSPALYGVDIEGDDERLSQTLVNFVHSAALELSKTGLLKYDKKHGIFEATELGKIASYYYISHKSMAKYHKEISKRVSLIEMFRIFGKSEEFRHIIVRDEEKVEISKLLDRVPIPIRESIEDPVTKINVLFQAFISRQKLEGFALMADMIYVSQSAGRIMRALFEISLKQMFVVPMKLALEMGKMINSRMWPTMSPLRQLGCLDIKTIRSLERKNVAISDLYILTVNDLQEFVGIPGEGAKIFSALRKFPRLALEIFVQPITASLLRIEANITCNFEWDDTIYGDQLFFWILVEDNDGDSLLFHDYVRLKKRYYKEQLILQFTTAIPQPRPPNFFVSLVSDKFLGVETRKAIFLDDIILPNKFSATTQLLDLQHVPVSSIKDDVFLKKFNPGFKTFNGLQSQVFNSLFLSDKSVLVCAPHGTGKSVLAELALIRHWKNRVDGRAVYLNKSIKRLKDLKKYYSVKYGVGLRNKKFDVTTGDLSEDLKILIGSDVIFASPEHWNSLSRRWRQRKSVQTVDLMICTDIQGIGDYEGAVYEEVISRSRLIASQLEKDIRIVATGVSIAGAKDLGEWIGCSSQNIFNFSPRLQNLTRIVQHFDGNHYPSLLLLMLRPLHSLISQRVSSKKAIVFLHSGTQCQNSAVNYADLAETHCQSGTNSFGNKIHGENISEISNSSQRDLLLKGLAFLHDAMSEKDQMLVFDLWERNKISILFASRETANWLRLRAYMVVIMGTQYYDAKEHKYFDYPVDDILQMFGRTEISNDFIKPIGVLMTSSAKETYYKKFLEEPLPVESNLHLDIHDIFSTEIACQTINSKQDAVDWMTWTYLYRRLLANPGFYGLQNLSHDAMSNFLSEIVETTFNDLEETSMISINDASGDCNSLNPAIIATFYNLSYVTMQTLTLNLGTGIKMRKLLEILSSCTEFEKLPIRKYEDILLEKLYMSQPMRINQLDFQTISSKVFVLLASHFSRLDLPTDLRLDQEYVLSKSLQILSACVDVLSSQGEFQSCLKPIELSQMIVQALWNWEPVLKQIPHFSNELLQKAENMRINDIYDFQELQEHQRDFLLKSLTKKQLSDVARFVNQFPTISLNVEAPQYDHINEGEEIELQIRLDRGFEEDEPANSVVRCSFFPFRKSENWWVIVSSGEALLAIRKVSFLRNLQIKMHFPALKPDLRAYKVSVLTDSYIGGDTEQEVILQR